MNKYVIFAFACAFALVNAGPKGSKESSSEEDLKEFAESIKEKFNTTLFVDILKMADKAKEKCPDIETKIESVAEQVGECVEQIDLGSDTFCSIIKKNFAKCSKPARELITSCLPDESKDLPMLGEKIVLALINNACSSTVEEILELFNPCAMEKDPESFNSCKVIKTTIDEHRNKLPNKSLVCSTIPKMRSCANDVLEASCKNPITRNSVKKFYDAVDVAVKDECDALNKA